MKLRLQYRRGFSVSLRCVSAWSFAIRCADGGFVCVSEVLVVVVGGVMEEA